MKKKLKILKHWHKTETKFVTMKTLKENDRVKIINFYLETNIKILTILSKINFFFSSAILEVLNFHPKR